MPAINPALGQTRSNVNFNLATWCPLQLLVNISIAAAAISFVLGLGLLLECKKSRRRTRRNTNPVDEGVILPQHFDEGIWEKSRGVSNSVWIDMSANQHLTSAQVGVESGLEPLCQGEEAPWGRDDSTRSHTDGDGVMNSEVAFKRFLRARPIPPPPLTRPLMATTDGPFEGRRSSIALSMTGDLDSSFFNQPNPDYSPSSSSSSSASIQSSQMPNTPRRRSYTRTLRLGPPQPVSWLEEDGSVTPFSPSSLPSSSLTLPLAPHEAFHNHEIDMKGEIISVIDNSGAGWKRHTRVYGGGVCLACMASEGEGGFYGDSVRPEEKR